MSTAGATPGNTPTANLAAEAAAFDQRIQERVAAGFVPDLRRMAPCDYFYKSFWRDPHFANLFVGWSVDRYLQLLSDRCGPGQRILDVGCGPGYVSLELARAGHHVTGIDISEANIDIARQTLAQNPWHEGFGSLDYQITPLHAVKGCWDVVLFSVSLHHMPDVAAAVAHAHTLVRPSGWLLTWEPCHDRFTERDAATVALVRTLLALTGHWYEPADIANLTDENSLAAHVRDVWSEYVFERDPSEPDGQSPTIWRRTARRSWPPYGAASKRRTSSPAIPTSTACWAVSAATRQRSGGWPTRSPCSTGCRLSLGGKIPTISSSWADAATERTLPARNFFRNGRLVVKPPNGSCRRFHASVRGQHVAATPCGQKEAASRSHRA
ncbi:class I SAM-dependent methyltransferase [Azospirillum cavernae]|nr:class I SAM-dependent methyltransferase [Azospirillum cavernae]